MAIINQSDFLDNVQPRTEPLNEPHPVNEKEKPSFSDTVGAAFRENNDVVSLFTHNYGDRQITDPDYDRFSSIRGTKYEPYANLFVTADNDDEVDHIKRTIDKEEHDRQILSESGTAGIVSSMVAGIVSPTALVPGLKTLKTVSKVKNAVSGLKAGAVTAGAAFAAQEGLLQSSQGLRTTKQSIENITAGMLLGGVMGAGVSALTTKTLAERVVADIATGANKLKVKLNSDGGMDVIDTARQSIGAAKVGEINKEGIARLNKKVAQRLSHPIPSLRTPVVEGLTSSFSYIQKLTNDLYDHSFVLEKNLFGEKSAVPVEALIDDRLTEIVRQQKQITDQYLDLAGISKRNPFSQETAKLKSKLAKGMSFEDFNAQVNDVVRTGKLSQLSQVNNAAKIIIENTDKLTEELKEVGVLPADTDVKYAAHYLSRVYNVRFMRTGAGQKYFYDRVIPHYARKIENAKLTIKARISELRKQKHDFVVKDLPEAYQAHFANKKTVTVKEVRAYLRSQLKKLDVDDAEDMASVMAQKTYDNIVGFSDTPSALEDFVTRPSVTKSSFTKERTLDLSDEELGDLLIKDASAIYAAYAGKASRMVEFNKYLQKEGFDKLSDLEGELASNFKNLRDDLTTDAERKTLDKEYEKAKQFLKDSVDIFMGRFGNKGQFDQGLRILRQYQTARLLGGVVLSSLPDMAMSVFKHGVGRTIRDGYLALVRNYKNTAAITEDLKDLHVGLELEMNNILKTLTDPEFTTGDVNKTAASNFADAGLDVFGKLSGMTYWNNFNKRIAGHIALSRIIREARKIEAGKNLKPKDKQRLLALGINDTTAKRIVDQFERFGSEQNGAFIANIKNWDNQAVAKLLRTAVRREVESTILTPGRGDVPRVIQRSQLAKTIFQFKSFSSAASNRILLSALNRRDSECLMGLVGLIGMGIVSYNVKEAIAGRTVDNKDIDNLLLEGVSRSGVLGLLGDELLAMNPWSTATRYQSQTLTGTILGPSATSVGDFFSDIKSLGQKAVDPTKEISTDDVKKLKKWVPFNNIFYLRVLLGKLNNN